MKCPHCGKDTQGEKFCGHCGEDLLASRGLEVEYKDFKVSELLDIKMPGKESAQRDAGRIVEQEPPARENPAARKQSRSALTALIIFLAAAAGFVLLKLLIKF